MGGVSRRSFLQIGSVALGFGRSSRTHMQASGSHREEWSAVSTPTSNTLHDVIFTKAGAYAVGANGIVLARQSDGWKQILKSGPGGNGKNLLAVATTDDGERFWMTGASGALGEYGGSEQTLVDHTAPADVTSNFTDIAVTGSAGQANVYVADASGQVHVSFANGEQGTWSTVTPGGGAAIQGIDFYSDKSGVLVDGTQSVFKTTDGTSWTKIGIADAERSLTAVDAESASKIRLVGGAVYSRTKSDWAVATPTKETLQDIAVGHCGCIHAVGSDGTILKRPGHGMPGVRTVARVLGLWSQSSPVNENLKGVALGPPHIAVGASGAIVER